MPNDFQMIDDYMLQNKEAIITRMDIRLNGEECTVEFAFDEKAYLQIRTTKSNLIKAFERVK